MSRLNLWCIHVKTRDAQDSEAGIFCCEVSPTGHEMVTWVSAYTHPGAHKHSGPCKPVGTHSRGKEIQFTHQLLYSGSIQNQPRGG